MLAAVDISVSGRRKKLLSNCDTFSELTMKYFRRVACSIWSLECLKKILVEKSEKKFSGSGIAYTSNDSAFLFLFLCSYICEYSLSLGLNIFRILFTM